MSYDSDSTPLFGEESKVIRALEILVEKEAAKCAFLSSGFGATGRREASDNLLSWVAPLSVKRKEKLKKKEKKRRKKSKRAVLSLSGGSLRAARCSPGRW
jgi:hypothetical protein